MNFTTRKISSTPPSKKSPSKTKNWAIFIGLCLATVIIVFGGIYALFANISLKELVLSLGSELEQDYQHRTNFLLIGTGVQGQNEASTLTDTIMIGSYNNTTQKITLLSIPRDLYINHKEFGGTRINQIYELAKSKYDAQTGIDMLTKEIEQLSGLTIHYYAKINFDGLKQIVTSLGGVEVNVENAIYDPHYPKDGTIGYAPFRISKGLQTLDGETALKYARSRKTTSDFDRARRQQQLIFAIKEKAMKREILTSPTKIKELFYAVSDNLETDLSIREIIELARLGQDVTREQIASYVLHDDPTQCGGFLYPPERELYGGAYILLPISDTKQDPYKYIHQFVTFILEREGKSDLPIQILNGTKTAGLAGEVKMKLQRFCFNISRFGNARNQQIDETTIYHRTETQPSETKQLLELVPGTISSQTPSEYSEPQYQSDAQLIIELGKNYAENERDDFLRYIYTPPPKKPETTEETSDTSSTPTDVTN